MAATHQLKVEDIFSVKDFVCVAKVYITGRRSEVLNNTAEQHTPEGGRGQIIPIGPCDVTSKQDLGNFVHQIAKKEKYINLLITNAGVSGPKGIPEASDASELHMQLWNAESVEDWSSVMTTNVTSGAAVHLSKLMSSEFEKADIRVNSIAPGYFPSEMTTKESGEDNKSEMPHEKIQEKGHVPAQRPGKDEEMAQAVIFLAKNMYVNGQVIAVDGGTMNQVPGS
ncbi:MAG: hypothetical protein Q9195_000493 [Heterodermia aff. obscurata]